MKYILIFFIQIFLIVSSINAQISRFYVNIDDPAYIPKVKGADIKTGNLILESNITELQQTLNKYKCTVFKQAFPTAPTEILLRSYFFECDSKDLGQELVSKFPGKIVLLEYLGELPEPDFEPNDYGLALEQGNLDLINAKQAYDLHMDIPKIPISVNDTYFDLNHEDLNIIGVLGSNDTNVIMPFHGTAVSGAASAISNNGKGLASVGYRIPICGSTPYGNENQVLLLAQAGYRVINCSWSGDTYEWRHDTLYSYIKNTYNTVVVCSAGNENSTQLRYPASYSANISVTSVGWETTNADCHESIPGDPSTSDQHNTAVDICAPGHKIPSTDNTGSGGYYSGNYGDYWGTSVAAPHVSGVVSIIRSINPCLTADETIDILLGSTDNSIYSKPENQPYIGLLGSGRLDAYQASLDAIESATIHIDGLNLTGTNTYSSGLYLSSANSTVKNGAHITFQAGRDITLDTGFGIELGGEFTTGNIPVSCP